LLINCRLKLARFLSELYELTEAEDGEPSALSRVPLTAEAIAAIPVEVDSATLHLPERITQPVVTDLLRYFNHGGRLHHKDVLAILGASKDIMATAPSVTRIPKPTGKEVITVVGDLHGSFNDLSEILKTVGIPRAGNTIVFNGDLVDRGPSGLEVLLSILALKVSLSLSLPPSLPLSHSLRRSLHLVSL